MNKKKWWNIGLIALSLLLAGTLLFFAVEGDVFADDDDPENPGEELPGAERRGDRRARATRYLQYGKDTMLATLAAESGIDIDVLTETVENRESLRELLAEAGFDEEAIEEMFQNAHYAAIDQLLADGIITEEQAEQMREHLPLGPFNRRDQRKERMEERYGENWREELRNRLNPDCTCTCP
jgi:uncharacterized membrane protein